MTSALDDNICMWTVELWCQEVNYFYSRAINHTMSIGTSGLTQRFQEDFALVVF